MVKEDEFTLRKKSERLEKKKLEDREKYDELITRLKEKANHFNTKTLMKELCASRTVIVKLKNGLPGIRSGTLVLFMNFIDRLANRPEDMKTAYLRPRGGFEPLQEEAEPASWVGEDDLDFLN